MRSGNVQERKSSACRVAVSSFHTFQRCDCSRADSKFRTKNIHIAGKRQTMWTECKWMLVWTAKRHENSKWISLFTGLFLASNWRKLISKLIFKLRNSPTRQCGSGAVIPESCRWAVETSSSGKSVISKIEVFKSKFPILNFNFQIVLRKVSQRNFLLKKHFEKCIFPEWTREARKFWVSNRLSCQRVANTQFEERCLSPNFLLSSSNWPTGRCNLWTNLKAILGDLLWIVRRSRCFTVFSRFQVEISKFQQVDNSPLAWHGV